MKTYPNRRESSLRRWAGIALVLAGSAGFLLSATGYSAAKSVHYIEVDGEISPGMAAYLSRSLEAISEETSSGVVLGIDTFGGRVDAALDMVEHIESVKGVPVYAYVKDKAWSAGALISLACEKILMQEGSSIGSAAPVTAGAPGGQAEALGEKYVSAIRAKFRALAERNGYNPDLAASMVDKELEILEVEDEGVRKIITRTAHDDLVNEKGDKKVKILTTISKKDKLVNLSAEKAKEVGLVEQTFKDKDAFYDYLGAQFGVAPSEIEETKPGPLEAFAGFITSAAVSGILLSLGLMLLYLEFQAPGIGWAGISGVICLALVFGGQYLIHYAEYAELILFLVGVILVCAEIFVIPGFGIPGIAGIICIAIAFYLSFVPFGIPSEPWEVDIMKWSLIKILGGVITSIFGIMIVLANIHRIPLLNKLVLRATLKDKSKKQRKPVLSKPLEVGREGTAVSSLRPVGKGRFGSGLYDVVSETGTIAPGSKIKVVGFKEYECIVTEVTKTKGGK